MIREGFWKWELEPHLPMPVASPVPFMGQAAFLSCLARVEAGVRPVAYKGVSQCRLCGCMNGNEEYQTKNATWPEGLRHYIEAHNVMPSQEFIAYITQAAD